MQRYRTLPGTARAGTALTNRRRLSVQYCTHHETSNDGAVSNSIQTMSVSHCIGADHLVRSASNTEDSKRKGTSIEPFSTMEQPACRSKRAHGNRHRRGKGGRSKHPTCIAIRPAWWSD